MIAPLAALARCTFSEVTRQPLIGVLTLATLLVCLLSPTLALFALEENRNLLRDFGVSTIFLSGLLIVASGVSGAIGSELELHTAQTLLAKPVGRGVLLAGKLLGVLASVAAAVYVFTLALLLAARIGPPEHAHEAVDWPAVTVEALAFLVALFAGLIRAFRTGRPMGMVLLKAACVTFTAGFLLAGFLGPGWQLRALDLDWDPLIGKSAVLALLGVTLLGAVSVLLAVLFGRGSLLGSLIVFLAGLSLGKGGGALLGLFPDFRIFWVGEIFYKAEPSVPVGYIVLAALYAAGYSAACLAGATWLLERREA